MRTFYGSSAVLKSTRDCTMLGLSMRRVGLIDITVGNATRLGASKRSTTRRCASHYIATQRLSRWRSPAARARFSTDGPPQAPVAPRRSWLELVRSWRHETDMPGRPDDVRFWGVERTPHLSGATSVFDPNETWTHGKGKGCSTLAWQGWNI
jgi:hypothetical protein